MKTFHSLTNAAFILLYFFIRVFILSTFRTLSMEWRHQHWPAASHQPRQTSSFFHHENFPEFFPPLKIFHLTCITKKFPINLLPSTVYHHRFSPTSKTPAFLGTGLHTVHTLQAPFPPRLTTLSHVNIRCIDKQVTFKIVISNRDE